MQGSESQFQGIELSLRDYVAIVVRHRWIFLGVFLAVIVAAVAWTAATPSQYQSTAAVSLRTSNNQQLFPSVGVSQRTQFVRVPAAELEYASSSFFSSGASSLSPSNARVVPVYDEGEDRRSSQLSFVGTAADPIDAQTAALAWAEHYLSLRATSEVEQLEATILGVEAQVADLEIEKDELLLPLKPIDDALLVETDSDTISRLTTQRLSLRQSLEDELLPITLQLRTLSQDLSTLRIASGYVTQPDISARLSVEPSPGRKVAPRVARNLALAPILGVMLAAGAVLLNESFRGVINSATDLSAVAPGVPVLTQTPEFARRTEDPLKLASDPGTPYAQSLERVVSSLLYERLLRPDKQMSVLVTSSVSGEGKTTIASHLALRLNSTPARTVLLDADLRRPDVHVTFGQKQVKTGLSHLLQAGQPLTPYLHGLRGADRVRALFAGAATDNAAALLRQSFPAAIETLQPEYDMLVVDAPPVLAVTDAEVMSHAVDGVIIVVRAGKTSRAQLSETMRKITSVDAYVVGFVLVGIKATHGYGYSYNYGYESTGMGQLPFSPEQLDAQSQPANQPAQPAPIQAAQAPVAVHPTPLPVADLADPTAPARVVQTSAPVQPPAVAQPPVAARPADADRSSAASKVQQRRSAARADRTKKEDRGRRVSNRTRSDSAAIAPPSSHDRSVPRVSSPEGERLASLWLAGIADEQEQPDAPSSWADDVTIVDPLRH